MHSEESELNLYEGEVLLVLRKDPSGWWEGQNAEGFMGWFPSNFVHVKYDLYPIQEVDTPRSDGSSTARSTRSILSTRSRASATGNLSATVVAGAVAIGIAGGGGGGGGVGGSSGMQLAASGGSAGSGGDGSASLLSSAGGFPATVPEDEVLEDEEHEEVESQLPPAAYT